MCNQNRGHELGIEAFPSDLRMGFGFAQLVGALTLLQLVFIKIHLYLIYPIWSLSIRQSCFVVIKLHPQWRVLF